MVYSPVVVAKASIRAGSDDHTVWGILNAPPDRCLEIVALNWRGGDADESYQFFICPPDTKDGSDITSGAGMFSILLVVADNPPSDGTWPTTQTGPRVPLAVNQKIPPGWRLMVGQAATNTAAFWGSAVCLIQKRV